MPPRNWSNRSFRLVLRRALRSRQNQGPSKRVIATIESTENFRAGIKVVSPYWVGDSLSKGKRDSALPDGSNWASFK